MYRLFLLLACFVWPDSGRARPDIPFRERSFAEFLLALVPRLDDRGVLKLLRVGHLPANPPIRMLTLESEYQKFRDRKVWFERLDADTWSKASKAISDASHKAIVIDALEAQCTKGDSEACDVLSHEKDAKKKWLAKQDVPSWGSAARAVSLVGVAAASGDHDEAKQRRLAELDARTWGRATKVVNQVVAAASQISHLEEECAAGNSKACYVISAEDDAKKTWLAELDVPSWKSVANTVTQAACIIGDDNACEMLASEEESNEILLPKNLNKNDPRWVTAPTVSDDTPPSQLMADPLVDNEVGKKHESRLSRRANNAAQTAPIVDIFDSSTSDDPFVDIDSSMSDDPFVDIDSSISDPSISDDPFVDIDSSISDDPFVDIDTSLSDSSISEEATHRWGSSTNTNSQMAASTYTPPSQQAMADLSTGQDPHEEARKSWIAAMAAKKNRWR